MAEQSSADYRGTLGRYALFGEIASGGMATVHLARLIGSVGFSRTVAIKRLHPHLSKDPDFVAMFLEEARLAARVRHPNVVGTLDVVDDESELFLVMEYVAGESLSRLVRKTREAGKRVPPRYAIAILCAALEGLHAAHEATSERGSLLGLVHRDVSPQNIHVGLDGVARVLDFGIAKATNRVQETRTDQLKGKVAYMSPEQLARGPIDRRADVYSAAVVLWETLTGTRLFKADDVPSLVYAIMHDKLRKPSSLVPDIPKALDDIIMKGLERNAAKRWASTREMAVALEKVLSPAPARDIGEWVRETAGEKLAWRIELVHRIESETSTSVPPPSFWPNSVSPRDVDSGVVMSSLPDQGSMPEIPDDDDDDDDERETLCRASTVPEKRAMALTSWARRHTPLALATLVLLLLCGVLLTVRLVQLEAEDIAQIPTEPALAEDEPAIQLGVSRPTAEPTSTSVEPSKPVASDCNPPYSVGPKGVRHLKPNCVGR